MSQAEGQDGRARPDRNLKGSLVLLVVLLVTAVATWFLVDPGSSGDGSGPGSAGASGDVIQQFTAGERQRVEPFTVELLDGGEFDGASLVGGVTVVNVWGSWCGPCREEAPVLARVARDTEGEVQFLGINVRDNPDAARAFERSFDIPYPSVVPGDSSEALLAFDGLLASAAVPSTVVVDTDGAVAARVVGKISEPTLRGLVEDVLEENPDPGR